MSFTSGGEAEGTSSYSYWASALWGRRSLRCPKSYAAWKVLDITLGARVSRSVEMQGQDSAELGIEAYPEFVLMPEEFTDDEG